MEHGGSRHDAQLTQLRQAVDDAFGDPVAEVLDIRIACRIDEGQNGYRVNRLMRVKVRQPDPDQDGQDGSNPDNC